MWAPQPLGTQGGMGVEGIRAQEAAASALQICRKERKGEGRRGRQGEGQSKRAEETTSHTESLQCSNVTFSLVSGLLQKPSPVLGKKRFKGDV